MSRRGWRPRADLELLGRWRCPIRLSGRFRGLGQRACSLQHPSPGSRWAWALAVTRPGVSQLLSLSVGRGGDEPKVQIWRPRNVPKAAPAPCPCCHCPGWTSARARRGETCAGIRLDSGTGRLSPQCPKVSDPRALAASSPFARGRVGGSSRAGGPLVTLWAALGDLGELGAPVRGIW